MRRRLIFSPDQFLSQVSFIEIHALWRILIWLYTGQSAVIIIISRKSNFFQYMLRSKSANPAYWVLTSKESGFRKQQQQNFYKFAFSSRSAKFRIVHYSSIYILLSLKR